jgi:lipopolysaccharide/colanic/teichoic acid biosynthesis glycosyltransferase
MAAHLDICDRRHRDERNAMNSAPQPVDVDPLKSLVDKVISATALLLTAPLFALVGLAIKIDGAIWPQDRGPAFHREPRISAGQPFTVIKFRTVQIRAIDEVHAVGLTIKHLERTDRGHTKVGRVLRRWYLDELPQLINILRGDMSLVGPRPPAPSEYARELSEGNTRKSLARAGLLGLQQAQKGQTTSFEEEIALDYEYVARVGEMSPLRRLAYEFGIILRCLRVLWEGKGL